MKKVIDNKKRHLLKNLLFLSPAAYLAACDSTNEQSKITSDKFPRIKLKMVTSFPKNLPDTDLPAQRLAKKIEQMSLGKIKITHYHEKSHGFKIKYLLISIISSLKYIYKWKFDKKRINYNNQLINTIKSL